MKIAIKKISTEPKDIALERDGIIMEGKLYRLDSTLLKLESSLRGQIELICDRSGEAYMQALDMPLVLYISDGLWDMQSQSKKLDSFEVIEFFDGFVDLGYILESEITSIKSDYHIKDAKE